MFSAYAQVLGPKRETLGSASGLSLDFPLVTLLEEGLPLESERFAGLPHSVLGGGGGKGGKGGENKSMFTLRYISIVLKRRTAYSAKVDGS